MLASEDGFDGLEIEWGTAAVDERLKHLFHVPAHLKDQVATVFDLIVGVVIMEPATLLFVEVEGEAHTGVNPTLADLAQSPYSPVLGQGVCDLRQTCGVRDRRKAVSFLGEGDARLARLAGNVFMTVQDHLGREGRMPADLDGQMAPVRIEEVKRVVVDIGHRLLSFDVLDVVRGRANPGDVEKLLLNTAMQDGKRVQVGFGQDPGQAGKSQALHLVRALSGFTVSPATESGDKLTRFGPFSAQCRAGNVKTC